MAWHGSCKHSLHFRACRVTARKCARRCVAYEQSTCLEPQTSNLPVMRVVKVLGSSPERVSALLPRASSRASYAFITSVIRACRVCTYLRMQGLYVCTYVCRVCTYFFLHARGQQARMERCLSAPCAQSLFCPSWLHVLSMQQLSVKRAAL